VLRSIQREYGGGSITEPELEAAFQRGLPTQSRACRTELGEFFTEWFDTAYPTASGATEPDITGPGLDGPGFSCKNGKQVAATAVRLLALPGPEARGRRPPGGCSCE
jgi:hypothetical protein